MRHYIALPWYNTDWISGSLPHFILAFVKEVSHSWSSSMKIGDAGNYFMWLSKYFDDDFASRHGK